MIECYYKWCPNHSKDEPLCPQDKCTATQNELALMSKLRIIETYTWPSNLISSASQLENIRRTIHE
jgi:hypothetical protein